MARHLTVGCFYPWSRDAGRWTVFEGDLGPLGGSTSKGTWSVRHVVMRTMSEFVLGRMTGHNATDKSER